MAPLQDGLLLIGQEFVQALKGLEAQFAGLLYRAFALQAPGLVADFPEVVGARTFDLEGLVGRGVKRRGRLHVVGSNNTYKVR